MNHPRLLLLVLLLLGTTSCVGIEKPPGVVIASNPPGARILVDGEDTGFVTPCNLGLPHKPATIDLLLPGYQPAQIELVPTTKNYLLPRRDAMANYNTWYFFLWLNVVDFLTPIKRVKRLSPGRIHVPLRLAAS